MFLQPKIFKPNGFTLAETLLALLILAILAVFTIPKIITNQASSKNNSMAKEAIAFTSEAFQTHKLRGNLSSNTNALDLIQYFNYVKVDTTSNVQDVDNFGAPTVINCSVISCYKLANGGIVWTYSHWFGGTSNNRFIWFDFDPDGSGSAYTVSWAIYYNGLVRTEKDMLAGSQTCDVGTCPLTYNPQPLADPSWFRW